MQAGSSEKKKRSSQQRLNDPVQQAHTEEVGNYEWWNINLIIRCDVARRNSLKIINWRWRSGREREKMKNEKHIKNNDDTKRFYSLLLYSERVFPSQKKKFRWNMKKMCAAFYFTRGSFFLLMQYFLRAVSCSNFNTTTSPREMYQDRREFRTFRCFWLLHAKSLMIVDRVAKDGMGTMGDNFSWNLLENSV